MILDDLWGAGLERLYDGTPPFATPPTVFRVPYRLCKGDELLRGLAPLEKGYRETLLGKMRPLRGGIYARAPYDEMALVSEHKESGVLLLSKTPAERPHLVADPDTTPSFIDPGLDLGGLSPTFIETWTAMLVMAIDGHLTSITCQCGVLEAGPVVYLLDGEMRGTRVKWSVRVQAAVTDISASLTPEQYREHANQITLRAATTNALLNLKNIVTQDVTPDPAIQQARARRSQAPLVSYKVLRVVPFGELRNRSRGTSTGATLPLHWIRGHVKRFTAERPLFGKISGDFWWQPALHGRDKARFVGKSYEVVA